MENHLLLKTMLRRSALCMCFVAVSVVGFAAKTNSITIEYFSAQKQKYELSRLGYLELDGNDMIVKDKSGNLLYKAPIGDVKKVILSDLDERTKVDNIADMSMVVYPNPTMNELFVQGMQVGDVLRVYTVNGVFVKEQTVEAEVTQVDIRDLAVGSYLIQSGDNIVKFIKE